MHEVVDAEGESELASVRQFFALDTAQTDAKGLLIQKMVETGQKLRQVRDCVIRIRDVGEDWKRIAHDHSDGQQTALFDESPVVRRKAIGLCQWLESGSAKPEMEIVNGALIQTKDECRNALETLTGGEKAEDVLELLEVFCRQLQKATGQEYTELGKLFRPNVGESPLPPVFLIDLTEQLPPKADNTRSVSATPFAFSKPPIERLRVAVAQPPISSSALSHATVQYRDSHERQIAGQWALKAVEEAVGEADLIVIPELFVPEDTFPKILDVAKRGKVGVICGMEGNWADGKYSNLARIHLPDESLEYSQYKRYPSNYEPESFSTRGGQLCFLRSSIGSFAVVICSDLREFDVIAAIEAQPFLDYLVICCCNPYQDIWKHVAIADAVRLNCFVIVSNWSERRNSNGFGQGSLCAAPTREIENNLESEPQIKDVSLSDGNTTCSGSLSLYKLDVSALFRDREKPKPGFLAPPRRRLHINR